MHSYGWIRDLPDQRDLVYEPKRYGTLPQSVDLRKVCPPVYNQGQLGSCTANAISAALDFERSKQGESFITPSRLFIYYNERKDDGQINSDAGATIRESVKAVKNYGACLELEWPYDISKFTVKPDEQCYKVAVKYEALKYSRVAPTIEAIQSVLASGKPVVIGISVYASFESPDVARTGQVPMPASNEQLLGGHAVLVVGYQDNKFIVRNSWGIEWGDQGYFYLPEDYLTNANLSGDFWTLELVK